MAAMAAAWPAVADDEYIRWRETAPNEYSAAFWVKFDKLPSGGNPFREFAVAADAEGRVGITLKALPTEVKGDFVFPGRTRVAKGEWHHVEIAYSRIRQRATFYMDGKFEWENDNLHLPKVKFADLDNTAFTGEVKGLVTYPHFLHSEELAISGSSQREKACAEAKALKGGLARDVPKALFGWADELARRADALAAKEATIAEVKALERDSSNLAAFAKKDKAGLADAFAVWVVRPMTQEPILPWTMPTYGEVADKMRVFVCKDEYETASVVVSAFKPLTIRKVSVGDLRGPGGAVIPSAEADVKLVKRWYRTGGAFMAYFRDSRTRLLVPDLLVNDDDLIRVDETERRNYMRFDYPTGRRYVDTSDPVNTYHQSWNANVPFKDAATLQPAKIPSAGRNLQYVITFHAKKDARPGLYGGALTIDTDAGSKDIAVEFKVLDVELPIMGSTYYDLKKPYISHVNSLPAPEGRTRADKLKFLETMIKDAKRHNLYHMSDLWNAPEKIKLAREAGMVPDRVFSSGWGRPIFWPNYLAGVNLEEITDAEREQAIRCSLRQQEKSEAAFQKEFPNSFEYWLYHSESSAWYTLGYDQGEERAVMSLLPRKRLFAHGWDNNSWWGTDTQDMHSSVVISREEADRWHSTGGEMINYADPFPGSENPVWFRRRPGMQMYKARMDGQMMHGWRQGRTPWNEWAVDWGGDGTYRNFCMSYPQQGGSLYKLCAGAFREAYDDVRYATRLKQLATANLEAHDDYLKREAQRALRWLEKFDGAEGDLDTFRASAAARMVVLLRQIKARGGVMPDPDEAIREVL